MNNRVRFKISPVGTRSLMKGMSNIHCTLITENGKCHNCLECMNPSNNLTGSCIYPAISYAYYIYQTCILCF